MILCFALGLLLCWADMEWMFYREATGTLGQMPYLPPTCYTSEWSRALLAAYANTNDTKWSLQHAAT